jgi:hypothetical protein
MKGTNANVASADYYADGTNGNTFKNNLLQLAESNYPADASTPYGIGTAATGNLFATDPLFVDAADIDGADNIHRTADDGLRLQPSSPAINAGDPAVTTPTTDITGATRTGVFDLGAYEGGVCPGGVIPSVAIAANPSNSITPGTSVTFTATPTNGGTTPAYQWKKNNVDVGTNSATYTDAALADSDMITCVMTSNDPCADPATATSNSIVMTVCTSPIRYVKPVAAGNGSGEDWANASSDLQAMIDNPCATEVWVAAGSYLPTKDPFGDANPADPRDKTFYLKDGVAIYGGFAGTESQRHHFERRHRHPGRPSGQLLSRCHFCAGWARHGARRLYGNERYKLYRI